MKRGADGVLRKYAAADRNADVSATDSSIGRTENTTDVLVDVEMTSISDGKKIANDVDYNAEIIRGRSAERKDDDDNAEEDDFDTTFVSGSGRTSQQQRRKKVDVIDVETISGRTEKHGSVSSVDTVDSDDEDELNRASDCLNPNAVS